jgi:hypothetical protein
MNTTTPLSAEEILKGHFDKYGFNIYNEKLIPYIIAAMEEYALSRTPEVSEKQGVTEAGITDEAVVATHYVAAIATPGSRIEHAIRQLESLRVFARSKGLQDYAGALGDAINILLDNSPLNQGEDDELSVARKETSGDKTPTK